VILDAANVTLLGGSRISSDPTQAPQTRSVVLGGDGAAVYVGNVAATPGWSRTGGSIPGSATVGALTIDAGAQIQGRSVLFDASAVQSYDPGMILQATNLDLSAPLVNFGNVPAGATGLNLSQALLQAFSGASDLTLTTLGGIDVYGSASVGQAGAGGAPVLSRLTFVGPGVSGFGAPTDSLSIQAGHVAFDNTAGATLANAGSGGEVLSVSAVAGPGTDGSISIAGTLELGGISQANLNATPAGGAGGLLVFAGASGASAGISMSGPGNLTLEAASVTAARGVNATVNVPGVLVIGSTGSVAARTGELGASLTLSAQRVDMGGTIDLPAGVVTIAAAGPTSADSVTLDAGSRIRVAGETQHFGSTTADASAGSISLSSANGSVTQGAGAVLDLSGAGQQGDAGSLAVSATQGAVALSQQVGDLLAAPGSAARGAAISIDAANVGSLTSIAQVINQAQGDSAAGGLSTDLASARSVSVRARAGNLALDAGTTLHAQQVALEADGGSGATDGAISIGGGLDANGPSGGSISLFARSPIQLAATSDLSATASAPGGAGGSVLISSLAVAAPGTTANAIALASGAQVHVDGGATGPGGTLVLRAPRLGTNDVAIADAGSVVTGTVRDAGAGVSGKIVEAVRVYTATGDVILDPTLPKGNLLTTIQTDTKAYMAAEAAGATTQAAALRGAGYSIRPGVEVDTPGNIYITTKATPTGLPTATKVSVLDLAATGSAGYLWRYGGTTLATSVPGSLTLRAGGSLGVYETVSDGFAVSTTVTNPSTKVVSLNLNPVVASAGDSWSFDFTAGADASSSNPMRVGSAASDLVIGTASTANPVALRTGTGSIELHAARDLLLNNGSGQQSNVVYTAGVGDFGAVDALGNPIAMPPVVASVASTPGRPPVQVTVNVAFTDFGGNLDLGAGRDVLGSAASNATGSIQSVDEWLLRGGYGTSASPLAWWVGFGQFQQGFGALGGGSLDVSAGRDLARVDAVVASNAYNAGGGVVEHNAGALTAQAGGRAVQGLYYDQAGTLNLTATTIADNPVPGGISPFANHVRFALGSAPIRVQSREGATLSLPFLPTFAGASKINTAASVADYRKASFLTIGPDSSFSVRADSGDVVPLSFSGVASTVANSFYDVTTPYLEVVSFGGGVGNSGGFAGSPLSPSILMAPSPYGDLRILADGSIGGVSLAMSLIDPASLSSAAAPIAVNPDIHLYRNLLASWSPTHASDPNTAEVVARTGSISGGTLELAMTSEVAAGTDIGSISLVLQNSNAGGVSTIAAGRDLLLQGGHWDAYISGITASGPGVIQVLAGGKMDLGTDGPGILFNGPSAVVAAGIGRGANGLAALPDYTGAISNFVRYDAFASMGSSASLLDQQVLATLAADDPSLAPLVAILQAGLKDRGSWSSANLAPLSAAQIAMGAIKLATAIQVVNNQAFVASQNAETFAPGYAAFADLFPAVANDAQVIRQFVAQNVFANASDGASLRSQVLQGLPDALAKAIAIGLAAPGTVDQADSAFSQALAAIDPATLASGARQLFANTLTVAGTSRDALQASGRLVGSGSPYARELTALAQAFSSSSVKGLNDLTMDYNQIKEQGPGSIAFFTPQGSVIVGQSSPPTLDPAAQGKTSDMLGIFTYGGGDIIGMARDNIDVYRSRIFTVAGGNIDLWSSLGNLDAGRGPRDIAVAPPPTLTVDANGVAQFNVSATVTGSGIGALTTSPDQPPSNIDLMAPAGYVDAGEAGIRAQSGTVTLGTNLVLNAGNIQAAGGVSGGAVVVAPPPPAPPSTGSSAGDRAVEEAKRSAIEEKTRELLTISARRMRLIGEFIGFEDCPPDSPRADCKPVRDAAK